MDFAMIVQTGLFLRVHCAFAWLQIDRSSRRLGAPPVRRSTGIILKSVRISKKKRRRGSEQENCFIYQEMFVHWKTIRHPSIQGRKTMFDKPVSRRQFSGWMLAATALATLAAECSKKKNLGIGIQLYTLRDLMQNDFTGTIEKVASLGYPAVEFAGYGGLSAPQVRDLLKRLNLRCCGAHEGYGALTPEMLEKTIAFNTAIANPYIVCPSMPREFREKGTDGVAAFADAMNQAGEKIKQAGMQLCYHNHDFEFHTAERPSLFDQLLQRTDAELVKMEIDTYWVRHAGLDPIALIKKLQNRCPLLHMKDMTAGEPHTFAPVGQGVMDIMGIIEAGREAGVQWLVVEQDRCEGSVLDAVASSYQHLHRLAG